MTVTLQRPLLVGGIGLTMGLWGLDSIYHSFSGVGDVLTLGAIAAGGGYWWLNRQGNKAKVTGIPQEIDRTALDKAIAQVELVVSQLAIEHPDSTQVLPLQHQLTQALTHLSRPDRHIAITGGQKVGKTSLLKLLTTTAPVAAATPLKYTETPALFASGAAGLAATATAERVALDTDLVLFLTNGDLTATEYKYLETLRQARQRVILLLNQLDRYLPTERDLILHKLQATIGNTLSPQDIVTTSTAPTPIKVRKIQADGSAIETLEAPPVEIAALDTKLSQVLATESDKLLWATTYRQLDRVRTEAKTALNAVRRERALPTIDRNQWIVAAAAFANPVPALDLIATAAVNAQMVMDLGAIYQQKFSIEHAQAAASALGGVMLKLGLVEVCTQTVAGVLKTNAVTYVAGGLVQGLSAAYLTRIAGLTLVEYLEAQDLVAAEPAKEWNLDLLGNTLQKVFQANQRLDYVQTVVKQGIERLVPAGGQNNVA
jgi:uncharacterized protein